ncbi:hypothetical protein T265_12909, partial [Opisthorchis viverrini]
QLNVLYQAASCFSRYDNRDIAIHVYPSNALLISEKRICKQIWFCERLTWNIAQSIAYGVFKQLNVLHQAAPCFRRYDIRNITIRTCIPRVSVNLMFYLNTSCTNLAKYSCLHTNLVLMGDSPETQLNLTFMMFQVEGAGHSRKSATNCVNTRLLRICQQPTTGFALLAALRVTECAAPGRLMFQLIRCSMYRDKCESLTELNEFANECIFANFYNQFIKVFVRPAFAGGVAITCSSCKSEFRGGQCYAKPTSSDKTEIRVQRFHRVNQQEYYWRQDKKLFTQE